MENLESLLPDISKIERWKVKDKSSKVKVYLKLKDKSMIYAPKELKKFLIDAKIPIDSIGWKGTLNWDGKIFCGYSNELGSYKLWVGGDELGLKITKDNSPEKMTPSGDNITGYQGSPSEKDKFGKIPDLLKVVRDYVALSEEKD